MYKTPLALAHLTSLATTPVDFLHLADSLAFDYIGLRLLPAAPGGVHYPLHGQRAELAQLKAELAHSHCQIFDIEIVRLHERIEIQELEAVFAVGQELGAQAVLVAGDDPEVNRLADTFARLCELGQRYGLHCQLEFMPWTAVANVRQALDIWQKAGQPEFGGVLVDSLHFFRSTSSYADVAQVPAQAMTYVQICDQQRTIPASVEAMIHDARCERYAPGEGELPLAQLLRHLPALPISLEIPNERKIQEIGVAAWVKHCQALALKLLH
ncbi:MAG: hypothetical protein RLZZ502_581 [Pseudomonadota bacterium]